MALAYNAIDADGHSSGASNPLVVVTPANTSGDMTAPTAPGNLTLAGVDGVARHEQRRAGGGAAVDHVHELETTQPEAAHQPTPDEIRAVQLAWAQAAA